MLIKNQSKKSKYLTVEEAASLTQVHPEELRELVQSSRMPAFDFGDHVLLLRTAVMEWMENPEAQVSGRKKVNILLIDDGEEAHKTASMLEGIDCKVARHSDPREALALLQEQSFAVVFLSLVLDCVDSVEVFRRIRGIAPGVPVAYLASSGGSSQLDQAMQEGPVTILRKPLSPRDARRFLSRL